MIDQVDGPDLLTSAEVKVLIHAAFDTDIIIDTARLSVQEYRHYADHTLALLRSARSDISWSQESATAMRGADDPIDFSPAVNLSFVMAQSPTLLTTDRATIEASSGVQCLVTFSQPVVYFHAFSAGIVSIKAALQWSGAYTMADLRDVNDSLLQRLAPMIEQRLSELVQAFRDATRASKAPLYATPFAPLAPPTSERAMLYWSHFIYVARVADPARINPLAAQMASLMMPIDDRGVYNMAIKPNRFIFLGWGRSLICVPQTFDDESVASYGRMLEVRNYLWKTLYDLDRGLRGALVVSRDAQKLHRERHFIGELRALDFRVKSVLEELGSFKVTFDHEKVWLIKQLDATWLMSELVSSLQERLGSFRDFYEYTQESLTREREGRLRAVLGLIGAFATGGAITELIDYFDPLYHLSFLTRTELIVIISLAVAIAFFVGSAIAGYVRDES